MGDAILKRVLAIFEYIAEAPEGLSAVELAELLGIHKTSIYRYLSTLVDQGYVRRDTESRYHLGTKILALGGRLLERMPLRDVSRDFLIRLSRETDKTVHLCLLDGQHVTYLDKVETRRSLPIVSRIGSQGPAYCTGVGKVLLAYLDKHDLAEYLANARLERRTESTITDPVELERELALIADRGYAFDDGEHEPHIRCLAAPIRGFGTQVVAAVSITGLARDFEDSRELPRLRTALLHTAAGISEAYGNDSRGNG